MKIQFFGCGNMGKIILEKVLIHINTEDIWVQTYREKSSKEIQKEYGVNIGVEKHVDIVFLLIKPQQFSDIDFSIFSHKQKYISFMAGINIKHIEQVTKSHLIIRAMPNIALSIGKGVLGYYSKNMTKKYLDFFLKLFTKSSKIVDCKTEEMIDKITLLSGSGLAYYYFLSETLEDKSQLMGFSKKESREIAEHIFLGSAYLYEQAGQDFTTLRNQISSKGGTTEAVVNSLKKNGFGKVINEAIDIGYKKTKDISSYLKS